MRLNGAITSPVRSFPRAELRAETTSYRRRSVRTQCPGTHTARDCRTTCRRVYRVRTTRSWPGTGTLRVGRCRTTGSGGGGIRKCRTPANAEPPDRAAAATNSATTRDILAMVHPRSSCAAAHIPWLMRDGCPSGPAQFIPAPATASTRDRAVRCSSTMSPAARIAP